MIFGRSLGGAVAFHSIEPFVHECNVDIAGVIIENSFTSIVDVETWHRFVSPLIADKWDNIERIDCMTQKKMTNIPFLFVSAINDSILNPVMMRELRNYCQYEAKFDNVMMAEFDHCDHNDTWTCDGYADKI